MSAASTDLVPAAAAPAGAASSAASAEAAPVKRVQVAHVLGLDIPPARVIAVMRGKLLPPARKDQRRAVKAKAKAGDAAAAAELEELNKVCPRFGGSASVAFAAFVNYGLKGVATETFDATLARQMRIVTPNDLVGERVPTSWSHKMFALCRTYRDFSPAAEKELMAEQTAANQAARARRAAKAAEEKAAGKKPAGKAADAPKAAAAAASAATKAADKAADKEVGASAFVTYIEALLKKVKAEGGAKYANIRFSQRLRVFMSDLVHEFLELLCSSLEVQISGGSVRTITGETAKTAMGQFLRLSGLHSDTLADMMAFVDEKLKAFDDHVAADQARRDAAKAAAMTAGEIQEAATKKAAAQLAADERHLVQMRQRLAALRDAYMKLADSVRARGGTVPAAQAAAPAAAPAAAHAATVEVSA